MTRPEKGPYAQYPGEWPYVVDIGMRHYVLPDGSEGGLWWHECPGGPSWGQFGKTGNAQTGHRVTSAKPLTVEGSLLCTECGDHGFIRDGQWVPA